MKRQRYLKRVDALDARMTNEELVAVKVMAQGEMTGKTPVRWNDKRR